MKKRSFKFLGLLAGLSMMTMVSCLDKDEVEYPTVDIKDVVANYSGKVVISHNGLNKENLILHTVTTDSIKFAEIPLSQIVSSIEKDDVKAASIVAALGKVKYGFRYEGTVRQSYGGIELALKPQPMELMIPTDNGTKKLVVAFTAPELGFYSATEKAMAFKLKVDQIKYDDVTVDPFTSIVYTLPYSSKTK